MDSILQCVCMCACMCMCVYVNVCVKNIFFIYIYEYINIFLVHCMPRNRTAGVEGGGWDQQFVFPNLYLNLIHLKLYIKRPPFPTVIEICFCYKADNYAYIGLLVNFNSVPLPSLMVDILVLVLRFSLRLLFLFFFPLKLPKEF